MIKFANGYTASIETDEGFTFVCVFNPEGAMCDNGKFADAARALNTVRIYGGEGPRAEKAAELTQETIQATREWFAGNAQACIDDAVSGAVFVNDLGEYSEWQRERMKEALAGEYDHTFAFVQRAHYIQTGECHALLR